MGKQRRGDAAVPPGGADPEAALESLRGRASDRKLRLFAVACCRDGRLFGWLGEPHNREAVGVAERFAEGRATAAELSAAEARVAHRGVAWACLPDAYLGARHWAEGVRDLGEGRALRAAWLAEVFGDPLRPLTLDHSWLTPDVLSLAEAAYEQRTLPAGTLEPQRLAVLADALEDAGCDNEGLLGHLRGPGPHVRGCWAVDLVLGKE
jgi:hypothetical protein